MEFDSGHQEPIHDAKLDYYGRVLATASSDNTIKIFQISGDQHTQLAELRGHDGPVWQVAWSNPKFNKTLLASCGYDHKIIIWQAQSKTCDSWSSWYIDQDTHKYSVNSIEFAPPEYGLLLLAGASDEHVSIHRFDEQSGRFTRIAKIHAHYGGVNSVSWSTQHRVQRFASGGSDGRVIVWRRKQDNEWVADNYLTDNGHKDWVRDVAWAPSPSQSSVAILASCSEDKTVKIWAERGGVWKVQQTISLNSKAWSISWSTLGNVLAVSTSSQVIVYKENADGKFVQHK